MGDGLSPHTWEMVHMGDREGLSPHTWEMVHMGDREGLSPHTWEMGCHRTHGRWWRWVVTTHMGDGSHGRWVVTTHMGDGGDGLSPHTWEMGCHHTHGRWAIVVLTHCWPEFLYILILLGIFNINLMCAISSFQELLTDQRQQLDYIRKVTYNLYAFPTLMAAVQCLDSRFVYVRLDSFES